MAETKQQERLLELCREFIEQQKIRAPETIYQADRVIENAYVFIEEVCDIVGYHVEPASSEKSGPHEFDCIDPTCGGCSIG